MRRLSNTVFLFFFQAGDGIRDTSVTGVQTCALPICIRGRKHSSPITWRSECSAKASRWYCVRTQYQALSHFSKAVCISITCAGKDYISLHVAEPKPSGKMNHKHGPLALQQQARRKATESFREPR